MASYRMVLAVKADDLSLTPETHIVEEKNQLPQVLHRLPQGHCGKNVLKPKKIKCSKNFKKLNYEADTIFYLFNLLNFYLFILRFI